MVMVGKPRRCLPVESRGFVRAEFFENLVGLVVELSSAVLGGRGFEHGLCLAITFSKFIR